MAKAKRIPLNEKLAEVLLTAKPANPALSSTDLAHLKSLKKRGFSDSEIINIAQKAGFVINASHLVVKTKEVLAAEKSAREEKKKQAALSKTDAPTRRY